MRKNKAIIFVLVLALMLSIVPYFGCGSLCQHDYEWTILVQPTCVKEGEMEGVCNKCDTKTEETIKALGHDFVDGVCTRCKIEKDKQYINEGQKLGYTIADLNEKAEKFGYDEENAAEKFLKKHKFKKPYVNKLGMFKVSVVNGNEEHHINLGVLSEKYDIKDDGAKDIYEIELVYNLKVVYEGGGTYDFGKFRWTNSVENKDDIVAIALNKDNLLLAVRADNSVEIVGKVANNPDDIDQTTVCFANGATSCFVSGVVDATLSNVVIPEYFNLKPVTKIMSYSFSNMQSLTTITIPKSVVTIGFHAFSNCENLRTINYSGTREEWEQINIVSPGDIVGVNIVYNYSE